MSEATTCIASIVDRGVLPRSPAGNRHPASTVTDVKVLIPWLAVLAVVLLLDAMKLGALATVVAVTWLVYCVWTWVRPRNRNRTR